MEATQVIMATFPTEDGADAAVAQLEAMAKAGSIEIIEGAVIKRDKDGETTVRQVNLPSAKKWAGKGALIGGIVGLVFPPSIIGTALVGAGIGAGSGALAKHALTNDELVKAAADLDPGTSSFAVIIDQKWAKELAKAMDGYAKLAEHTLEADTTANLEFISDEAAGIAAMSASVASQSEDGAMAASVDVVSDLSTGATYAEGATVYTDGEVVAGESFQVLEVPDEVPDAVGGYEKSLEESSEEE